MTMTMTPALKSRENRLRRQASRRGLRIVKAPGDLSWGDLGAYLIMDGEDVIHVVHHVVRERKVKAADWRDVLDEVEAFLLIAGRDARR
jgi:hypothetical protein